MTDITIPRDALEAAAKEQARRDNVQWDDLNDLAKSIRLDDARAACLAMLRNWPGMDAGTMIFVAAEERYSPHIILPLTENTNDKG